MTPASSSDPEHIREARALADARRGPFVATIKIVERDGRWCVEVYALGLLVSEIEADSEAEAEAIFGDLVAMAREAGGRLQ